jgi:thiosulfate dehydrogenase [quinone] large subunit
MNSALRPAVAAVAALVGGYLLYIAADNKSNFQTAFTTFWLGLVLFIGVAWVLLRAYQPGRDEPSSGEVNIREWKFVRFLRYGKEAAPFYLGLRLFLAVEWIEAGLHKVLNYKAPEQPAHILGVELPFQGILWTQGLNQGWVGTGASIKSYWERAAAVSPQGTGPIVYPAYRAFIQYMIDNNWHTWYGPLVAYGEVLIGLGFLFGGLIGFAAFFALLMNFAFMYAGSTSSNPTLVLLQMILIFGWRPAGYWGIDRFLLPMLGTPWSPGHPTKITQQMASD